MNSLPFLPPFRIAALAAAGLILVPSTFGQVAFPPSGVYEENFDGFLGEEWFLQNAWETRPLPFGGQDSVTTSGDGGSDIIPSQPNGLFLLDDMDQPITFFDPPLPAIVEPSSYESLGFSGSWLYNLGVGDGTEISPGVYEQQGLGIATLSFVDLPEHQSLNIGFLLGAGGSYDGTGGSAVDGPFELRVDGDTVLTFSGGDLRNRSGVQTLAFAQNLVGLYREQWNDNAGAGPASEDDRFGVGWTLDSAYDLTLASDLIAIPHSADTLVVDFIHRLSSEGTDELHAIDNLTISLNDDLVSPLLDWPGGTSYHQDFDGTVGPEWNFDGTWGVQPIPAGVDAVINPDTGFEGSIRNSEPTGLDETSFGADTSIYPLEPLVAPSSFTDLDPRFEGSYATTLNNPSRDGRMDLTFNKLPPHSGIDLDFVLTAADSIDADDDIGNLDNVNFRILVDETNVFEANFEAGGGIIGGPPFGVFLLGSGLNATPRYIEEWNDNAGFGPTHVDDRFTIGWTLDSAWDFNGLFDPAVGTEIPHTADSITVTFIHGLNDGGIDESISIDAFTLTLLGVPSDLRILGVDFDEVTGVSLVFTSMPGEFFRIERSTDLLEWTPLEDPYPASPAGETTQFADSDPPPGGKVFYRVIRLDT
ncbi:hypothetical protein BH23VER1_BH23VER1_14340 [soil metagenome]